MADSYSAFSRKLGTTPWARLAILSAATLVLAGLAAFNALGGIANAGASAALARMLPTHPALQEQRAARLVVQSQGGASVMLARELARQSLTREPLNPKAMRTLGLTYDAERKRELSLRAMLLSERLSRRDTTTQLWLIEHNSQQGDVDATLAHYDTALRVKAGNRDLLFPVLAQALDSAEIRQAIGRIDWPRTPWLPSFLEYAIGSETEPLYVALLVSDYGGFPNEPSFAALGGSLLNKLILKREFPAAHELYRSMVGTDVGVDTSMGLSAANTNLRLSPVSWTFASTPEGRAVFRSYGGTPTLHAVVEPGARVAVATKRLFLRPGSYRLAMQTRLDVMSAGSAARWRIYCTDKQDDRVVWEQSFDQSSTTRQINTNALMRIDCPFQLAELFISGGDAGSSISVRSISIISAYPTSTTVPGNPVKPDS